MLLPLSWLSDFVDISDISVDTLAHLLTMSGSEVTAIHRCDRSFDNIVTAEIVSLSPHPNADKLRLATVQLGEKLKQEVVCGASNIEIGQKVPLACVGAVVGDVSIEKRKIRGVVSNGMLCSAKELGISDDHTGILILDPDTPVGLPLADVIKSDIIFDIDITPNRPDCLSILGLAREVACLLQRPLRSDIYNDDSLKNLCQFSSEAEEIVTISLDGAACCGRYFCILVDNITIQPSPLWMQLRLLSVNMRPINNIVDITNYLLMAYGQPLHAFDLNKLQVPIINVRNARDGEVLRTLDGEERVLNHDIPVIAQGERSLALAGIMGGEETAIDEHTTSCFIEVAHFDGLTIRKASEILGLRTDASSRFEKNIDIHLVDKVACKAIELFQCHGGGMVRACKEVYSKKVAEYLDRQLVIDLSSRDVKRVLGINSEYQHVGSIFSGLGFVHTLEDNTSSTEWKLSVTVPSWRRGDITEKYDLIEEIGRIMGYDKLPSTMPTGTFTTANSAVTQEWSEVIQDTLVACGYYEIFTYQVTSEKKMNLLGIEKSLAIPLLSTLPDFTHMRYTLIPDLLVTLQHNLFKNPSLKSLKLFEFSRVFRWKSSTELPQEPLMLGGVSFNANFFDVKGLFEILAHVLHIDDLVLKPLDEKIVELSTPWQRQILRSLVPLMTIAITLDGNVLGFIGKLTKRTQGALGIPIHKGDVILFEVEVEKLMASAKRDIVYKAVSKYPSVFFDCSFFVDVGQHSGHILAALSGLSTDSVCVKPTLFDVYKGKGVEKGKKSLAFSIEFIPYERTLGESEVREWQDRVVACVEKDFDGKLRDAK